MLTRNGGSLVQKLKESLLEGEGHGVPQGGVMAAGLLPHLVQHVEVQVVLGGLVVEDVELQLV